MSAFASSSRYVLNPNASPSYKLASSRASAMDIDNDPTNRSEEQEQVTFASAELKALSKARSDPKYEQFVRPAEVGQALQLRLQHSPPTIYPEYEASRLLSFFVTYVQDWELGNKGLSVKNASAAGIHDSIPPWDFAWTDEYLLDPSVPPIEQIKPRPPINGFQLTDELCVNYGCNCQDDECDPQTCACLRRAADCYPFEDSHYQRMFANPHRSDVTAPAMPQPPVEFVYDYDGRLHPDIPEATPIFECNKHCSCSESCRNRVVQKGKQASLSFYKTESKGWGIKANQFIPRGTFVGAYGGELLGDVEAERRAQWYDRKLGTTYLQSIDSHILKVHLTRQILEEELARKGTLGRYRGSDEAVRKMVKLISQTADEMEHYDEYYQWVETEDGEAEGELWTAENKKRLGEPLSIEDEDRIFSQAKAEAGERAYRAAKQRREKEFNTPGSIFFQAEDRPAIVPEADYDDPVWNFLSLPRDLRDRIRKLAMIRSDMEDEHFLTIDAALLGNHTRFFNHSCDPNIYHVPVYTNNASLLRPLLAFFTFRDIQPDEELCFSYAGDMTGAAAATTTEPASQSKPTIIHPPTAKPGADTVAAIKATDTNQPPKKGSSRLAIVCACGAKNCTGRVFS